MKKKLRSFIHENFPFELRVEIELLSRRRDIFNDEKQSELMKILRKYEIPGIVPLGPGTNRYAFKLKGFVVKVATDADGKIDNFKEFKMTKRLYPHVAKTYEVSENGTLLIAEYISPFQSYGDMLAHADQIREILKKLSAVYLIGDVGIIKKNYANWGLRIGSDDPVCLDFAYVYDVKSELFLCKACKNNSMLVPNNDFSKLICPAPGCGKEYEFEDIRRRLGNDVHDHEIGDLSEEGYLLSDSNVLTELTENRSNYLEKPKVIEETKEEELEEVTLDNFIYKDETNLTSHEEEGGNKMSVFYGKMVSAKVLSKEKASDIKGSVIDATVVEEDEVSFIPNAEDKAEEKQDEPVFSAKIIDPEEVGPTIKAYIVEPEEDDNFNKFENKKAEEPDMNKILMESLKEASEEDMSIPEDIINKSKEKMDNFEDGYFSKLESKIKEENAPKENVPDKEDEVVKATVVKDEAEHPQPSEEQFEHDFIKNMYIVPLRLGQKIAIDYLYKIGIFDKVKSAISFKGKARLYPEQFYSSISHGINHAIMDFCKFEVGSGTNKFGKECKFYYPPKEFKNQEYTPTLMFMQRFYKNSNLFNAEDASSIIDEYKKIYGDEYAGLQPEVLDYIRNEIKSKFSITESGLDDIIKAIDDMWICRYHPNVKTDIVDATEISDEESHDEVSEENVSVGDVEPAEDEETETTSSSSSIINEKEIVDAINQSLNEDYSDYDDDEDDAYEYLSVSVFPEDNIDVINIFAPGAFGNLNIPIYIDLNKVSNEISESQACEDNGIWDWLIHFNPDKIIRTNDPSKYLIHNTEEGFSDAYVRFAVLDEAEDGSFLVGMYIIEKIIECDDEFNEISIIDDIDKMVKINNAIVDNIGITNVSHLEMSLSRPDLVVDESEFDYNKLIYADDDEDDEDDAEETPEDFNEEAALNVLMSAFANENKTFKPVLGDDAHEAEATEEQKMFKPILNQ